MPNGLFPIACLDHLIAIEFEIGHEPGANPFIVIRD
jgi:hypothetical protein